jgi:hypothetical protein
MCGGGGDSLLILGESVSIEAAINPCGGKGGGDLKL